MLWTKKFLTDTCFVRYVLGVPFTDVDFEATGLQVGAVELRILRRYGLRSLLVTCINHLNTLGPKPASYLLLIALRFEFIETGSGILTLAVIVHPKPEWVSPILQPNQWIINIQDLMLYLINLTLQLKFLKWFDLNYDSYVRWAMPSNSLYLNPEPIILHSPLCFISRPLLILSSRSCNRFDILGWSLSFFWFCLPLLILGFSLFLRL